MPISLVVLQTLLIILALAAGGYLFISLKRDIAKVDGRRKAEAFGASHQIAQLKLSLADLKKDLEALPALAPGGAPQAYLNLNRRTQALRMSRMGERPEHIAAALQIPRKEVELLVKVQRLLIESSIHPPVQT